MVKHDHMYLSGRLSLFNRAVEVFRLRSIPISAALFDYAPLVRGALTRAARGGGSLCLDNDSAGETDGARSSANRAATDSGRPTSVRTRSKHAA